jgi:hypothetical protein
MTDTRKRADNGADKTARSVAAIVARGAFLPPGASITALKIPRAVTFAEYRRLGHALGRMGKAAQWWYGDWMLVGEQRFGEEYAQAVSETGLDENTLLSAQYVASRFPPARRREVLSWSHHREVAALEPELADKWLDRAEKESWSRAELRRQLRPAGDPKTERDDEAREAEQASALAKILVGLKDDSPVVAKFGAAELRAFAALLVSRGVQVKALDE